MSYNLHVCCSVANKQKLSYENSNWYPEVPASIHVVDHIYRVFRLLGWSQKVSFWLHESAYIARLQGLIGKEEMWRMSWWLVGGSGWFWRGGADRGESGVRESRCPLPIITHQPAKLFTHTSLTAAWTQYWPPLFWHCHLLMKSVKLLIKSFFNYVEKTAHTFLHEWNVNWFLLTISSTIS